MVDIVRVPIPDSDPEAWKLRDALLDAFNERRGPLPERVQGLYNRLTARYPCICQEPDGVWSDGPLINDFGPEVATLGIIHPRVTEVFPFLVSAALEAGFTVFDGQEAAIYRPGRPVSRLQRKFWPRRR